MILAVIAGAGSVIAQSKGGPGPQVREVPIEERRQTIGSLKGVEPLRADLSDYIADKAALQQLGKALFWDVQVGSQGVACASCHFHAGADIRIKNQVDPGVRGGDVAFNLRNVGKGIAGPNKTFGTTDFPFHRVSDPKSRQADVQFDSNDVFSSQGSFGGDFVSSNRGHAGAVNPLGRDDGRHRDRRSGNPAASETCTLKYDPASNPFHANNLIYRKVEPRQTPTVINAVFNYRQFWDGRANHQFNGVDPFGARTFQLPASAGDPGNPNARKAGTIVPGKRSVLGGVDLRLEQRLIDNSSLASQAVGPPLSDFEMSCANKTFADLGRKLLPSQPLAVQKVHPDDSLLGRGHGAFPLAAKGLDTTYRRMIQRAFKPKYWIDARKVRVRDDGIIVADPTGFTQMEHNFSLFWGLAIQEYEALLISDDTPFDRARNGNPAAMSDAAKAGEVVFLGRGGCIGCHFGPAFSAATVTAKDAASPKVLERMRMGSGDVAFYDSGFYNIGARPTAEDVGAGATDPYGFELSFARQYKWSLLGQGKRVPDRFDPTPCKWIFQYWPCSDVPRPSAPEASDRDAVDGSFKAPILRNVGLNPPYFHNGGQASLKDVVRFYNRGGDRRGDLLADTSGLATSNAFGQTNSTNLDADIGNVSTDVVTQYNALSLSEAEMDYLVQFLLSLTDERVACHSGIFDHPELPLPMGQLDAPVAGTRIAQDIIRTLPAVGVGGLVKSGKPCFPNSGDLFGSVNKLDPTGLQAAFRKIVDGSDANDVAAFGPNGETTSPPTTAVTTAAGQSGTASVQTASLTTGTTTTGQGGLTGVTTPAATNGAATTAASTTAPATVVDPTKGGTARPQPAVTIGAPALSPDPPPVPAPVFTAPVGSIKGFSLIGFIQNATVGNQNCPDLAAPRQWGGTAIVNSITVTIPCNTVVQMPAATFTWAELFPPSAGGVGTSPIALSLAARNSGPAAAGSISYPSTELRLVGNIVDGQYIAGLVFVSQQSLNTGAGVITGFDYASGTIFVANNNPNAPPIRLQINDNKSRFTRGQSPDVRFNVDDANPTVRAVSGYPMCVPRISPDYVDDVLCPQRNRPKVGGPFGCRRFAQAGVNFPTGRDFSFPKPGQVYCSGFVMGDPANALPNEPTSMQQAPLEVGDYITYSGTLLKGSGAGAGTSDTISVHTVTANVGIFTQPGTLPVYLAVGEFRVAAYAPIDFVNGVLQEEQDRIVLEAFVTDVTSVVDIYLVDNDPITGKETQRWITPATMTDGVGAPASSGQIITGGITTQFNGAVPGRVRLRANRAVAGILASPTRFVRVVARSLCDPANINGRAPLVRSPQPVMVECLARAPAANGLLSGQYMAPTIDFIFPETIVPGDPPPANNFWDLGFLVNGEGPGTGRLQPTPW